MGKAIVTVIVQHLDSRFDLDEMIRATDLQTLSWTELQDRLAKHHKLLVMHYSKPLGVLLEADVFRALIERLAQLEEQVEAAEAARLIDQRTQTPEEEWVTTSPEQFFEDARQAMQTRFTRKTRAEGER